MREMLPLAYPNQKARRGRLVVWREDAPKYVGLVRDWSIDWRGPTISASGKMRKHPWLLELLHDAALGAYPVRCRLYTSRSDHRRFIDYLGWLKIDLSTGLGVSNRYTVEATVNGAPRQGPAGW